MEGTKRPDPGSNHNRSGSTLSLRKPTTVSLPHVPANNVPTNTDGDEKRLVTEGFVGMPMTEEYPGLLVTVGWGKKRLGGMLHFQDRHSASDDYFPLTCVCRTTTHPNDAS